MDVKDIDFYKRRLWVYENRDFDMFLEDCQQLKRLSNYANPFQNKNQYTCLSWVLVSNTIKFLM